MMLLHHSSEFPTGLSADRQEDGGQSLLKRSILYREFLAEREEVLKHKWFESEKAGRDIGMDSARTSWITRHRALWRKSRREVALGGN